MNGTFVQTADGDQLFLRRDSLQLKNGESDDPSAYRECCAALCGAGGKAGDGEEEVARWA